MGEGFACSFGHNCDISTYSSYPCESCSTAGVAAANAESRKHDANDPKCVELGWICIPLAVEAYGNWGKEAQETFSQLASLLAVHHSVPKSKAAADIYDMAA